ncbi:putative ATPase [Elasticomyces elasticus]|uniref:ATPase n=1 Tax=Exophiala sideris TaxID=1016849 RepID=A0ABR0JBJ0_9EURO|nr:putative ATPase [Elasticomyces elasticus]KAK5030578.1 putative ATPase [Exophiala sideris]KAK5038632.1 putative ATPase [Exophiala sideris]KAK5060513.1 putative ATPase [Exophiala sideris]KAK5183425.1 putative ATPase [Eurotiomycetes sp. CCFEE 6388]
MAKDSPSTVTTSTAMSSAKSTPASSPAQASPSKVKSETKDEPMVKDENKNVVNEEDDEEMDHKSRALTNLLKTSSVFVAIMADKMKEQQKRNQEQARRAVEKQQKDVAKQAESNGPTRKSARTHQADEAGAGDNDTETEKKIGRGRGRTSKKTNAAKKNITEYFDSETVNVSQEGPTVQEALAEAAEEYEGEGLGAQQLVATEQPSLVTGGNMKQYQLEGLEWLKTLWMNGLSGILADEMGLGKTLQAISMIAFFKENNISGPFLVAAPLSTVRNWVEEFKHWTPSINTVLYHGSKDEREAMRRKKMKIHDQSKVEFPVVVTSYEICMNDKKFLGNYQWRYVIVDEGHRLKNMNCKLIKDLMTYSSANRLLITGTPLQNNIAELWSLLHFLLPEVFNDLDSFERWFDFSSVLEDKTDDDGKTTKRKNNLVSTMHAILKPFLLRRVKADVESSLPKKREYILYAPLTSEQKELYREILAGTGRSYLEDKAVERIEARSRAASLKRKAGDSGRSTPAKSLKASRASTPASVASTGSVRRGRKGARTSYRDVTDGEFNKRLRQLERGDEDVNLDRPSPPPDTPGFSSEEAEEFKRAQTLKLAKKEISSKKMQNPIMQARLACNSPHNFYWPWKPSTIAEEESGDYPQLDESLITASGKILLLDTLLPRLFKLGHKVLIFSQFKTTLDILASYAVDLRGWKACRIDGSVAQEDRYDQITYFNTDRSYNLFLLSTRAGGQGINLTAADTVILFDSDWNPQQDLQAMDRAHRIGQTKPVIVYRLATRGTVEETLLFKADAKRKLEKLIIQKGKFKSLLNNGDAEGMRGMLEDDEFEKYDIAHTEGKEILGEDELRILTDRSDEAYERAEKGIDVGGQGKAFKVAETKRSGVLEDLTVRSKA